MVVSQSWQAWIPAMHRQDRSDLLAEISAALRKEGQTASKYPPEGGDEVPIEKRIGNRKTSKK